jgi:regulator of sigma E protease
LSWRSGEQTKTATLHQVKTESKDELGQLSWAYDLGVRAWRSSAAEATSPEKITLHWGPGRALAESLQIVPKFIAMTAVVLYRLVTFNVPLSSVGGPIMLYQIASKSAEAGLDAFLSMMAIISINLGLMNLLPIPILDGFHLFAAIWEGIRRKPIPTRAREVANWVGLAMLLALMVLVFKNDLTRTP